MPGIVLRMLLVTSHYLNNNPIRQGNIIFILQMRELRHREANWLAQGHTGSQWWHQEEIIRKFMWKGLNFSEHQY